MPILSELYLETLTLPPDDRFAAPPARRRVSLAARCRERFRAWRQKRRWVGEMRDAAALGRLDEVLDDVGMTHAELDELIAAPADAGLQFAQMAELQGADLDRIPPARLREAIRKCTRCTSRTACKRWLRDGEWRYDGDPRCPNAALLRR